MAASFLDLTNELLRELNEVALTAGSFSGAVGIQAHIKDCVNRAYLDIVNEEPQWPFLAVQASGTVDPMYGNVSVETTEGTRWYLLKTGSASATTDYGYIDWDTFYLTTIGVSGETSPYISRNLRYMTIEEWKDFYRVSENIDDADSQNYGVPKAVIRSPDNRKFGLSPIPDKTYKVWFFAYVQPTQLTAYSDQVLIPITYKNVLMSRARFYALQFKENVQAAALANEEYRQGLRKMRSQLMTPTPEYMKDDRMRFV